MPLQFISFNFFQEPTIYISSEPFFRWILENVNLKTSTLQTAFAIVTMESLSAPFSDDQNERQRNGFTELFHRGDEKNH